LKSTVQEKLTAYKCYDKFAALTSKRSHFGESKIHDADATIDYGEELVAEYLSAPKKSRHDASN